MTLMLIAAGAFIAWRGWQWWRYGDNQLHGGFPFPAAVLAFVGFAALFALWVWIVQ